MPMLDAILPFSRPESVRERRLGLSGKNVQRMVKALDINILVDHLNAVSQPTILASGCLTDCEPSQLNQRGGSLCVRP